MFTPDHFNRTLTQLFLPLDTVDILSKRHLMSGFCPDLVFLQPERNGNRILSRQSFLRKRKRIGLFTKRLYLRLHLDLSKRFSISLHENNTVECVRVQKQILIDDRHPVFGNLRRNILIIIFYFLHLRGRLSVSSIDDAVRAEIIVGRPLAKISSIRLEFLSIPVFLINGLIDIIPDKASLVQWICVRQIRILMHCSAGIPHGMGIFTADKRLAPVFCKKFFDFLHRSIHLTFHVARIIISAVVKYTFIMYQPGRILLAEKL